VKNLIDWAVLAQDWNILQLQDLEGACVYLGIAKRRKFVKKLELRRGRIS